jgi:hypothetical protein
LKQFLEKIKKKNTYKQKLEIRLIELVCLFPLKHQLSFLSHQKLSPTRKRVDNIGPTGTRLMLIRDSVTSTYTVVQTVMLNSANSQMKYRHYG